MRKPQELQKEDLDFLTQRHLATLSIPRDGLNPHVTPVAFTFDLESQMARVITFAASKKVRLLSSASAVSSAGKPETETERNPKPETENESLPWVSICQVDGASWLTLSGPAAVSADPERCREGERRYAERYRPPKDRGADRRVIEISVKEVMGTVRTQQMGTVRT